MTLAPSEAIRRVARRPFPRVAPCQLLSRFAWRSATTGERATKSISGSALVNSMKWQVQPPQCGHGDSLPGKSCGEHRGDVFAMFVEATDPRAEPVTKATGRAVGEGVIGRL